MAQGCAGSPAGSGADRTAAVTGTIFVPQKRVRKARFRYLRTLTVQIADRKSGEPLFCGVWSENEMRSVEGPDASRGSPEGTAPRSRLAAFPFNSYCYFS